jgi:hypothetical protein
MAIPVTRTEFKGWCLRKLGAPVISINLDDTQIEDAIDEAIQLYQRIHFNGSELIYIPYLVTQTTIDNKYLSVPPAITGVTRIFQYQSGVGSNVLNTSFILASDALWQAMRGTGMASYQLLMNYRSTISMLTSGEKPIRFNRTVGKVHVDQDWTQVPVGSYIVMEGWSSIDPLTNALIWSDDWLQRYACALIKLVWGQVLKKYTGVQLPGGITMDGQTMWTEATDEIANLKVELTEMYTLPPMMMVG